MTPGEVDAVVDAEVRHREADRQAAVLDALPAGVALLDADGVIVSVNDEWWCFDEADALQGAKGGVGLNYLEVCDQARGDGAADAHEVAAGIRSVLSGGAKGFSLEYPRSSPTPERQWFELTVTPLAAGGRSGVVVMRSNTTERKRTADALAELSQRTARRERMLTTALSSSSDFTYLFDREGRFLFANQALLTLWKRTLEEAVGKNFYDLAYPADLAGRLQREIQHVFETRERVTGETAYTNPAGLDGWRELTREVLVEHGYRVIEATGPQEAIEVARRHPERIDLLLTDVVMPGMNGRALAGFLATARPALRALYMSGYTDDIVAKSGVLASGTRLLQKPFTTLALLRSVRAAVDLSNPAQPS